MDAYLLVCRPVGMPVPEGSTIARCRFCDKAVSVTVEGRKRLLANPGATVVCNPCGLAQMQRARVCGRQTGIVVGPMECVEAG